MLILVSLCWGLGAMGAIAFPRMCFIDQARQQPDGMEVMVTGNVTVPSGAFGSSNLDEGFVIQDETGGIYVTTDRQLDLKLGETVEVKGKLRDDGHGQRMLSLMDWHRSDRALPAIVPKATSAQAAAQYLDGEIVTVRGKIVRPLKDDAPYGDRLWIEDETGEIQIYMPKSTHINPQEWSFLKPGQAIQVTGFSSQFDSSDEVIPRSRADIQLLE
jgi:uncharacterized protein YdeI (BOF family)